MDAFIGEIRAFPFTFNPQGWFPCDGRLLSIVNYQTLFSLLGYSYGGSQSIQKFGLPNLQGQAVFGIGQGPGLAQRLFAQKYGEGTVTLNNSAYMATHSHTVNIAQPSPNNLLAKTQSTPVANSSWLCQPGNVPDDSHLKSPKSYSPAGTDPDVTMYLGTTAACGGANGSISPHSNMQPYLSIGFFICNEGIYPISD